MTDIDIQALEKIGWMFLPTGPNEWSWLKFDKDDILVAQGGDSVWSYDLATTRVAA